MVPNVERPAVQGIEGTDVGALTPPGQSGIDEP
jgi:hypothetical protein